MVKVKQDPSKPLQAGEGYADYMDMSGSDQKFRKFDKVNDPSIADPDSNNPSRHRSERPLDTIRQFESAARKQSNYVHPMASTTSLQLNPASPSFSTLGTHSKNPNDTAYLISGGDYLPQKPRFHRMPHQQQMRSVSSPSIYNFPSHGGGRNMSMMSQVQYAPQQRQRAYPRTGTMQHHQPPPQQPPRGYYGGGGHPPPPPQHSEYSGEDFYNDGYGDYPDYSYPQQQRAPRPSNAYYRNQQQRRPPNTGRVASQPLQPTYHHYEDDAYVNHAPPQAYPYEQGSGSSSSNSNGGNHSPRTPQSEVPYHGKHRHQPSTGTIINNEAISSIRLPDRHETDKERLKRELDDYAYQESLQLATEMEQQLQHEQKQQQQRQADEYARYEAQQAQQQQIQQQQQQQQNQKIPRRRPVPVSNGQDSAGYYTNPPLPPAKDPPRSTLSSGWGIQSKEENRFARPPKPESRGSFANLKARFSRVF